MLKLTHKMPRNLAVAVSGGVDSVAVLDYLAKKHNVTILHVDHNEGNSKETAIFVAELAKKYSCELLTFTISTEKPKSNSREEFWRNQRYSFFHSFDFPVVTGHNLDDCVETWIWSSMHGQSRLIPYNNKNVVRPFRTTKKADFKKWAVRNNLDWIEDESNKDMTLTRNYIRHQLMPHALVVNPGLPKVVLKKILKDQDENYCA
jgi:tRNA(Ile)-lysidine synthase